jgi:RNA polymerase sigma factor (sigma-70 family)
MIASSTAIDALSRVADGCASLAEEDVLAAERRLIVSAQAGRDWACTRLVEDHQDRVYRFCLKWLRDTEEARDVCQETFVRAFRALEDYEHRGRFVSWLYRIAMNLCRDHAKSRSTRNRKVTTTLESIAESPCPTRDPAEAASVNAEMARLFRGIDALSQRHREVIVLCGIEGLSHQLCAEVLDSSPRAIEGRLMRARAALEAWLAREN